MIMHTNIFYNGICSYKNAYINIETAISYSKQSICIVYRHVYK